MKRSPADVGRVGAMCAEVSEERRVHQHETHVQQIKSDLAVGRWAVNLCTQSLTTLVHNNLQGGELCIQACPASVN